MHARPMRIRITGPPLSWYLQALCLVGEFNSWSPSDGHWAFKNAFGVWELFLPDKPDGSSAITHRCVWRSAGAAMARIGVRGQP